MPRTSQTIKRLRAASVVAGVKKRLPLEETYWIKGKLLSHAELVAFFQAQVDALDAIRAARSVLAAAVARERRVARRVAPALPMFKRGMIERFGAAALADFGWEVPKKPGPKTPASKLAGALKGKATREARRTTGREQKLKIRGGG